MEFLKELEEVIKHFEKYYLLTKKFEDYVLLKQAFNIVKSKNHLTMGRINKDCRIKNFIK